MSELLKALEMTAQEMRESYTASPPVDEKMYRWVGVPGTFDTRAHCIPCDRLMGWAMEIRKEYGETINKTTIRNGAHQVIYLGRPVQVWKCDGCKQTVVK